MSAPQSDGLKIAAINKSGSAQPVVDQRRTKNGKFTMSQLRATDGIVPLQYGTNQFDSQKGKTGFGMPRNTATKVEFADDGKRWIVENQRDADGVVRLQSGTNQFDSQKGMTGFGMPRNTSTKVEFADDAKRWAVERPADADGLVRLQSGTNQFESQKGMTGFGTPRDVKGKHLKRIWELEFPEEAVTDAPINAGTNSY